MARAGYSRLNEIAGLTGFLLSASASPKLALANNPKELHGNSMVTNFAVCFPTLVRVWV